MTLPAAWWPVAAAVAVAVSPLLAGWSAALAGGVTARWWRPRRVAPARWAVVAVVVAVLEVAAVAGSGTPWPAWALFAAGGAVLAVVDGQVHQLPARFLYPLATVEAAVLVIAAAVGDDGARLLRAVVAAAAVGLAWLTVVFLAPVVMGLGDVRLFALTAGLLGWISWPAVLTGQLAAWALAGVTALLLARRRSGRPQRGSPVPMGPAIIAATVLASWL